MVLKKKKVIFLLTVVIIAALTVFAGCQPKSYKNQNSQPQNNASSEVAAPQQQEQIPEDLKGFTEYTVKKQLGDKSKGGKDRIRSINIENKGKESVVTIDLNGNYIFSGDMTVRGMLMDSRKILEPLSKRQDVRSVSVSEYLDVEDIGGGTVEEWVFTLTMDRSGLDKVAGGNYLMNDLTKLATVYKIHPNWNKSKEQAP